MTFWITSITGMGLEAPEEAIVLDAEKNPQPAKLLVAKAIAVVGKGYGVAIILEDYGLVFVQTFADTPTLITLRRSDGIRTSLGVDANYLAIVDENESEAPCVFIYNVACLNEAPPVCIPTPPLDIDLQEQIWQLSIARDLVAICTSEHVFWLHSKTNTWIKCNMKSVVAVQVNAELDMVAILTALGDIVIADALCQKKPKRLEKESELIPFVNQHTRDDILAWGKEGIYISCLRMIKPGGVVQQVTI